MKTMEINLQDCKHTHYITRQLNNTKMDYEWVTFVVFTYIW